MNKNIKLIYFSPNGSTRELCKIIGENLGAVTEEYDLTSFNSRWNKYSFDENDLIVMGMPTYGGRLPGISEEVFRTLSANKTPGIFIVSYGNRAYDEALYELKVKSQKCGFIPVALGAFPSPHSFSKTINANRPDEKDKNKIIQFVKTIKSKMETFSYQNYVDIEVPNKHLDLKILTLPFSPTIKGDCDKNIANLCPVCAINPNDPSDVDVKRCINCTRCIHGYPNYASFNNVPTLDEVIKKLEGLNGTYKEPELFI